MWVAEVRCVNGEQNYDSQSGKENFVGQPEKIYALWQKSLAIASRQD